MSQKSRGKVQNTCNPRAPRWIVFSKTVSKAQLSHILIPLWKQKRTFCAHETRRRWNSSLRIQQRKYFLPKWCGRLRSQSTGRMSSATAQAIAGLPCCRQTDTHTHTRRGRHTVNVAKKHPTAAVRRDLRTSVRTHKPGAQGRLCRALSGGGSAHPVTTNI